MMSGALQREQRIEISQVEDYVYKGTVLLYGGICAAFYV